VLLACLVSIAAPAGVRYHEGIVVVWLCCLLFLLTGTVLLYGLSVVDRQPKAAWLATAAVSTAVYTGSFGFRLYLDSRSPLPIADGIDLLMAVLWLLMVVQASRERSAAPVAGPFALGALTGAAGVALQVAAHDVGPVLGEGATRYVVEGALVLVGVSTVAVIFCSDHFPPDVRTPLLVSCALATVSRVLTPAVPTGVGARPAAAALLGLVATALFCREAAELLIRARAQLAVLARLRVAELVAHDQEEQLHEVRSGLAALGAAARLLAREDGALADERRHLLAVQMHAEMERLGRIVGGRSQLDAADERPPEEREHIERDHLEEVALDDVLETVIVGRRLSGQHVEWEPIGEIVLTSRDALVEAFSILLVNADQHAPGATVRVSGATVGDEVRIVVADDGPGIPPELRPHLFTRGVRGEDSRGEGIGLSLAHRIVTSLGGRLRLAETTTPGGAAFEMALPARTKEVVA
jgi:two-component system OmpR family sensor kinase